MGEEGSIQQQFALSIKNVRRGRPRVHPRGRRRPRPRHAGARRVHHCLGAWKFTPIVAHHIALCLLPPFAGRAVRVRRSVNPTVTQVGAKVGQNWGIVGIRTTRRPNRSSRVCSTIPLH